MTLVRFNNRNCVPERASSYGYNDLRNWFFNDFERINRIGATPPANIIETSDDFKIELMVPGFRKEDFRIKVEEQILSVSAEVEQNQNSESSRYSRHEFGKDSFTRRFRLSNWVDSEKIEATYQDGILGLVIPKKEETKAKPVREIVIN